MISGVARVGFVMPDREQSASKRTADAAPGSRCLFNCGLLTARDHRHGGQLALGFAGFFAFFALALTGFRAFAGVMPRGRAALTGAAWTGSGRK